MQRGPLVMHSHRIESAKKLTHYHRRSSCLQEKQGASLPGARPLSSGIPVNNLVSTVELALIKLP